MLITKVVMRIRTITHLFGVIGTTTAQLVVFGWLMAGTKSGASGIEIGVGSIMDHGRAA